MIAYVGPCLIILLSLLPQTPKKPAVKTTAPAPPATATAQAWNDWREEGLKGKVQQVTVEVVKQNEDGTLAAETLREKTSEFFYDQRGLRTKMINYFEGKISSTSVYSGTFTARTVTATSTWNGQTTSRTTVYKNTLNPQGWPIRFQSLQPDGTEYSRAEYEYNDKGWRIKSTTHVNGKFNSTNQNAFDDKGELTQTNSQAFEGPPSQYLYNYEFDAHGNWIKRITKSELILNNKKTLAVSGIVFRQIKYYP